MKHRTRMDLELREYLRQEDEKMKTKFYAALGIVMAMGFVMGLMTL